MQRLPETGRLGIVPTHMSCVVVTSDDTITARIENFLKILYWETMACSSSNVGRNNINGRKLLILICTAVASIPCKLEGEPCGARSHFYNKWPCRLALRYGEIQFYRL
ncbi:hypothetical protein TNCV_3852991 [Trichonephila clavipes]|nr:hypothetical protein TNCV_3852991 [Trichonephila clavipes]